MIEDDILDMYYRRVEAPPATKKQTWNILSTFHIIKWLK
jgi:hypothetical protein